MKIQAQEKIQFIGVVIPAGVWRYYKDANHISNCHDHDISAIE